MMKKMLALALLVFGLGLTATPGHATTTVTTLLNGYCLDLKGGINEPNTTQFIIYPCHGQANQQFYLPGDGTIRLSDGRCVDARGGAGKAGDDVIIYPCHGGANQKWSIVGDGLIKGINDLCLDVKGGATAPVTPVIIWPCHGGSNQRWSVPK